MLVKKDELYLGIYKIGEGKNRFEGRKQKVEGRSKSEGWERQRTVQGLKWTAR